jgi:hypothetical protein
MKKLIIIAIIAVAIVAYLKRDWLKKTFAKATAIPPTVEEKKPVLEVTQPKKPGPKSANPPASVPAGKKVFANGTTVNIFLQPSPVNIHMNRSYVFKHGELMGNTTGRIIRNGDDQMLELITLPGKGGNVGFTQYVRYKQATIIS